jgi:hypothetical protein
LDEKNVFHLPCSADWVGLYLLPFKNFGTWHYWAILMIVANLVFTNRWIDCIPERSFRMKLNGHSSWQAGLSLMLFIRKERSSELNAVFWIDLQKMGCFLEDILRFNVFDLGGAMFALTARAERRALPPNVKESFLKFIRL